MDFGPALQFLGQLIAQRLDASRYLADYGWNNTLVLAQQRQKQVGRFNSLVVVVLCDLLCMENRFLRFLGIFVEIHTASKKITINRVVGLPTANLKVDFPTINCRELTFNNC